MDSVAIETDYFGGRSLAVPIITAEQMLPSIPGIPHTFPKDGTTAFTTILQYYSRFSTVPNSQSLKTSQTLISDRINHCPLTRRNIAPQWKDRTTTFNDTDPAHKRKIERKKPDSKQCLVLESINTKYKDRLN